MISMVTCKQAEGRQWEGEEEEEDENENGNEDVEGQQLAQHAQRQHQRHQSVPRTLVYDVESGSLRFPKSQRTAATSITTVITTTHKVLQLKATPPPHSKSVKGEQQGNNHFLKLHSESCSENVGDSSPTCVIRNSTIRSTSSSPTMSTISKESRHSDEQVKVSNYRGMSPGSETGKVGDVRASKKADVNTPGRTWLKGATAVSSQQAAAEKDLSGAKENGFSVVMQDGARGDTEPFKAIQSSTMADKSSSMEAKYKKPSITRPTSNGFTLYATSMLRNAESTEPPCEADSSMAKLDHQNRNGVHRSVMGPLLKPTPSKWDDAEKWLTGGNFDVQVKAKSRSGPLLPHVVANQAGMGGQRKGANLGTSDRRHSGPLNVGGEPAARPIQVTELHENVVEVVNPKIRVQGAVGGAGFLEFTNSTAKQQLDLLLDRYSLGELKSRNADGNLMTGLPCDHHGSFLKIPSRTAKPTKESFATGDDDATLGHYPSEAVSVQDTGTAMTPIESADPSRTATPLRGTTTPVKNLDTPDSDSLTTTADEKTKSDNSSADQSVSNNSSSKEETLMALADKEFQAKTRQEILALSQRLGKANIAAWATTKGGDLNHSAKNCDEKSLDLQELRRSVIATRAAAWEESEKAKHTSRFQQEEARIQAWESNEKAKAEAEMRKIEDKAERMRSRAHAKLMKKLASARRQAEELQAEAEAHRADATAKTTKRAEIMKTTGKFPSLLFFNLLCT